MSEKISQDVAVIILAAGLGTRMKSNMAKVLHTVGGQPMINYVIESSKKITKNNVIVVVGYQADRVKQVVSEKYDVTYCHQNEQLGTGHAVKMALGGIKSNIEQVIILCGDVPLVRTFSISKLLRGHLEKKRDLSLIAARVKNPHGYGRVIFEDEYRIRKIVEQKDASTEERKIDIVNTGIYCVEKQFLCESIAKIKNDNQQKEYYLTDIIDIGYRENKSIGAVLADDPTEFLGINTPEELDKAENILKNREL